MPVGTPGPSTFEFGSTNLGSLFFAFQDVSSPSVSDAQHATAVGEGAVINFVGRNLNSAGGVVTSFSLTFDGILNVTYDDVDMSFDRLRQAIVTSPSTSGQSVVDAFRGIDWHYNLSKVTVANFGISGTGGDDVFQLNGKADLYYLDGGNDRVKLGGGADLIYASNEYGYSAKGVSIIDGQGGADTLFLSANLHDFFQKTYAVDLNATVKFGNESFKFKSIENLIGSSHGEKISGTASANKITGLEGNDFIYGRGGRDILSGGVDDDTYIYGALNDSRPGTKRDVITDFDIGDDKFDFSALHPHTKNDRLIFIDDEKFHKKVRELRFETADVEGTANDKTIVQIDFNGDRKADMEIELTGLIDLTKHDFAL